MNPWKHNAMATEQVHSIQQQTLCRSCTWAQNVRSARGSVFLLCTHSQVNPAYPKYPPQPVNACAQHSPPEE